MQIREREKAKRDLLAASFLGDGGERGEGRCKEAV